MPANDKLNDRGFDKQFATDQDPEVEGHLFGSDKLNDRGFDKAHDRGFDKLNDRGFDKLNEAGDEPEVEGHVHPIIAPDYARSRTADYEARGARARMLADAHEKTQDGGLLDKIFRRKEK